SVILLAARFTRPGWAHRRPAWAQLGRDRVRAASLARVKFVISVIWPSGRCTRHIFGHFKSGLISGTVGRTFIDLAIDPSSGPLAAMGGNSSALAIANFTLFGFNRPNISFKSCARLSNSGVHALTSSAYTSSVPP